jgi:hypothetical protein
MQTECSFGYIKLPSVWRTERAAVLPKVVEQTSNNQTLFSKHSLDLDREFGRTNRCNIGIRRTKRLRILTTRDQLPIHDKIAWGASSLYTH